MSYPFVWPLSLFFCPCCFAPIQIFQTFFESGYRRLLLLDDLNAEEVSIMFLIKFTPTDEMSLGKDYFDLEKGDDLPLKMDEMVGR